MLCVGCGKQEVGQGRKGGTRDAEEHRTEKGMAAVDPCRILVDYQSLFGHQLYLIVSQLCNKGQQMYHFQKNPFISSNPTGQKIQAAWEVSPFRFSKANSESL